MKKILTVMGISVVSVLGFASTIPWVTQASSNEIFTSNITINVKNGTTITRTWDLWETNSAGCENSGYLINGQKLGTGHTGGYTIVLSPGQSSTFTLGVYGAPDKTPATDTTPLFEMDIAGQPTANNFQLSCVPTAITGNWGVGTQGSDAPTVFRSGDQTQMTVTGTTPTTCWWWQPELAPDPSQQYFTAPGIGLDGATIDLTYSGTYSEN